MLLATDSRCVRHNSSCRPAPVPFGREVLSKVTGGIAEIAQPEARFFATRPFYHQMA